MNYQVFSPSCLLQDIVKQYVVINNMENIEKLLFLPNGGSFIVFNRGIKASAKLIGSTDLFGIPDNYSINFKTNRVKQIFLDDENTYSDDMFPIIMVELMPMGLYKLFNIDMSLKEFKYQELEDELTVKYFSKLYQHNDYKKELEYLDNSLEELMNAQNNFNLPIEEVVKKIYNDYNLELTVEDLLEEFDYSRSTLERYFKKMVGLTPKNFIFVTKFTNTLLDYIENKRTFHEIQYLYSDNSHMNAVFKKFLGIAPSEILTKVIDGEVAIYQLLNINLEKNNAEKNNIEISPLKIIEHSKNINVLYVEDEESLRESMSGLLENYFKNLDVSTNGEDAFKKYLNNHNTDKKYDLIITDMPKLNGMDMSREMRKLEPELPIIIMSAHCEYITSAKELGINAILNKPVDFKELTYNLFNITKKIYDDKLAQQEV